MQINERKSSLSCVNMEEYDLRYYQEKFPFPLTNFDMGFKYLGFHIKPNNYYKKDWMWLVTKLEKRIQVWIHKWLSRVGRLVLVKLVLEVIPVYWMSLEWIPKGILEKSHSVCF